MQYPESPVPTQNRSLIVPIWHEFWGVSQRTVLASGLRLRARWDYLCCRLRGL